jgi:hypothetical protein
LSLKVLVTGSRDLRTHQPVFDALDEIYMRQEPMIVIHGDARGADKFADVWAVFRSNVTVVRVPADWPNDGGAAGPIRNSRMLELGPELVLAFFQEGAGNHGTTNMTTLARRAGVPVQSFVVPVVDLADESQQKPALGRIDP